MFHMFEGFETSSRPTPARQTEPCESLGRRVTTSRACTSCRHRKIKCDGEKPCEACRWYKKADQCHYSDVRPSHRYVNELSTTVEKYRRILGELFPNVSLQTLTNLPREKLVELAAGQPQPQQGAVHQHPATPTLSTAGVAHQVSPLSTDDDNLESLQSIPADLPDSPNTTSTDFDQSLSDDVNGLALWTRQPSSYLGVSSIQAILKVIVWLDPGCAAYLSRTPVAGTEGPHHHSPTITPQTRPTPLTEVQLFDAYFLYFQAFAPMIDEQAFRETHAAGNRRDNPWLALLNIVLALGCVAAARLDDSSHQMYFRRCKSHLSLSSLGSPHIETIQTLGLISGWYCHYLSQPNLANSLMGAALRMAATQGFHKEPTDSGQPQSPAALAAMDIKRRVWWSLFCMDTWAGMTLGRPSMDRFGMTITVKPPHRRENENILDIVPLVENIRFCRIATQVQDSLAAAPLVKQQMSEADVQVVEWWENLPAVLKDYEPCPESIKTVRTVMRWRYYNQRMLLYRPTLLSYAMRRVSYVALRAEERTALEKCREMAELSIQNIAATAHLNQLCGWNAVWWTFQASMVPLLGLYLNDPTADDPRASIESCQAQVETAIMTLTRMQPFGHTAKSSLDAVSRVYNASKRTKDTSTPGTATPIVVPSANPAGQEDKVMFPPPPLDRDMLCPREADFTESLPNPFVDDPNGQYLWDYLSWSDNSMWPGLITEGLVMDMGGGGNPMNMLLSEQSNYPDAGRQPPYMDPMPNSAYYVNPPVYY
ncbi:hypothetical protein FE257_003590 [Aspergillus nanangensis]|uniref:Zn(2)-C6 fungal-type domain-containing protein n=1 Tax=Aspergillus nanangensis TaxID=2582783 RepID=A0AAD4CRV5_ASPNN|nr:hypothetical protein FE257_003590 [Aspergillus nanangensis]